MSAPTYTVTEEGGVWFLGEYVSGHDTPLKLRPFHTEAAARKEMLLHRTRDNAEEMLALLVESKKNETIFNADTVSWPARRDALIKQITGEQK